MKELPKGWTWCKVKDIAQGVQYGYTGNVNDKGNARYLRITDIQRGRVDWNSVPFVNIEKQKYLQYKLEKGNIVFARTGATAGKSFLIDFDIDKCVFASYLIRIIPNLDKISPKYLYAFFQSPDYWSHILNNVEGAAQPNFNGRKLSDINIPLPPLPEQKRIVAKLDASFERIDKSIALLEENIRLAEGLMGGVLEEVYQKSIALGEFIKLEEICEKITDGSHFSPKSTLTGFPYVTVKDINNQGEVDFKGCKKISLKDYEVLKKNGCEPQKGDILFSKDGTVGKVALVDFDKEWVVLSSLAIIRPKQSQIDSLFLSIMLQTPSFQQSAMGLKTGAAIKRLVLKTIKNINVPVPSKIAQENLINRFLNFKVKITQLSEVHKIKLLNIQTLKASILDSAFKGEL